MTNYGHGGTRESNLTTETSMDVSDFIRIVTSGSRKITLQNLLNSSVSALVSLGFVNGGLTSVTNISTNYGLLLTDVLIFADASSSDIDVNLMLASSAYNATDNNTYVFTVKKIDNTSNVININPNGSELIDGTTKAQLYGVDRPYIKFASDGSNWWTV